MGQLVREALDEVCFKTRKERPLSASDPLWGFVGAGESDEPDVGGKGATGYALNSDTVNCRGETGEARNSSRSRSVVASNWPNFSPAL